jgi:tetratricopeptide (TPR) repeat protein
VSALPKAAALLVLSGLVLSLGEVAASDPCDGTEGSLASIAKALDEGRWSDAEAFLYPLDPSHSDCVGVVHGLARLRAAQGDPEGAERLYSRALTLAPEDAASYAIFARFQLSRGLMPQAAFLTSQALSIDPDCPEALVIQGKIMGERGNYGDARAVLEKAVALAPDNPDAQHELGVWFYRVNLFDRAARQFETAISLNPFRTRSLDYLAICLEVLGEAEPAERYYRQALRLQEKGGPFLDPTLDYNFGRFLLKQGRLEESLVHLDRAVELFPKRRGPRYQRAKLYLVRGDYESARQDAEHALALGKPGDVVLDLQVHFLLTKIYTMLGQDELAEKHAELARTTEIPEHADDLRRR